MFATGISRKPRGRARVERHLGCQAHGWSAAAHDLRAQGHPRHARDDALREPSRRAVRRRRSRAALPRAVRRLRRHPDARRRGIPRARHLPWARVRELSAETDRRRTDETVEEQLVKHIDEAHAMEQGVLRMLDAMIATTDDPAILQELEHTDRDRGARAADEGPPSGTRRVAVDGQAARRHRRRAREDAARPRSRREGRPQRARRIRDRAHGDRELRAPEARRAARRRRPRLRERATRSSCRSRRWQTRSPRTGTRSPS